MIHKKYFFIAFIFISIGCNNNTNNDKSRNVNVLLEKFDTHCNVPPFDLINDSDFIPAFENAMNIHLKRIDKIIENKESETFENTIEVFDTCGILLDRTFNIFKAMYGTYASMERMKIAEEIFPELSKHYDSIFQNEQLFNKIEAIYKQKEDLNLTIEQKSLLDIIYRKFLRAGINLEPNKRKELSDINFRLAELRINFLKNMNKFYFVIGDSSELEDFPDDKIILYPINTAEKNNTYEKIFYYNKQSFETCLESSPRREFRKKIFNTYLNFRKNDTIISEIVNLRLKKANIFGYKNYAFYILDTENRMLKTPDRVLIFLDSISKPYFTGIRKQTKILNETVKRKNDNNIEPFDWYYYSKKYQHDILKINDKDLEPYFEFENILKGLFSNLDRMFHLKVTERKDLPTFGKDVRIFEVSEKDGKHTGIIYISLFAGHTDTDYIIKQYKKNGKRVNPVILMNFNFSRNKDKLVFLSLKQTKNLYHEFGHSLNGLLSNTNYYHTSGINNTIDFMEFPSQYFEKIALHKENLKQNAKHYKTGEPIPEELINKIQDYEQFIRPFNISERTAAAYLDIRWHTFTESNELKTVDIEKNIIRDIELPKEIYPRYVSNVFNHIFAGDYAVGYYGYLWTDNLVEQVFNKEFKKKSIFNKNISLSFRKNILEKGTTENAELLLTNFFDN